MGQEHQTRQSRAADTTKKPTRDPMQAVFDRIAGADSNAFNQAQLQKYLEASLQFADGEWFRSQKLSGAAAGLMEKLDADQDGMVSRAEFETFRTTTLEVLAPGLSPDADEATTTAAAQKRYAEVNGKGGEVTLAELQTSSKEALPKETEHLDLIAQLGARLAIDAIDTNQRDKKVSDRTLSSEEWTQAALATRKKKAPAS